ncbi:bifunctional riboflavin kinase/FAD synthetase [Sphingomicrobium sediminis]|uniref:Riboflavin biosynthesis protein n=1 Tax=Sphingomicrobium sediminis TaxID=2950949 RepID=A0A9X2EHE8_9SPHN|nr:bifunctional riboflavin kinase/FAD synthetase [Sphingomicrobium sediminis]MCM8557630.1 bifunctional riboflavin kinase/FAD synthetase [Sphingomicrobium sediminis]
MQRFTHTDPVPAGLEGAVIALGNFDGFHFGHQAVVGRAIARAAHEGRPAIVATFDPHPVRHFRPDAKPFRLTSLDQREEMFGAAGADGMLVFAFDDALASLTAAEFVAMLADVLKVAAVVTGEDFTFGKGREGNVEKLAELGAAKGIAAEAVHPVELEAGIVSSSRIREALQAGDPGTATRLLTRPFAIRGEVVHGDKRGRELGWPTANMEMGQYLRPAYGVYATRVTLADGSEHDAVSNLGVRPMFDPPKELLETFIFDFAGDLYEQEITVALHHYLRPEAAFHDMDALKRQMDADGEEAKRLLAAGSATA